MWISVLLLINAALFTYVSTFLQSQVFAKFDYRFQAGHSSNFPVTDCHENLSR